MSAATKPTTLLTSDIADLADWALEEFGLTQTGWMFKWDRAVKRAGCCHYTKRQITLSQPIFGIEENRYDALDTILHEVAHALVGPGAGHGPVWQAAAASIGASTERCHSLRIPILTYAGACGCGPATHSRARRPAGRHRCRRCRHEVIWSSNQLSLNLT